MNLFSDQTVSQLHLLTSQTCRSWLIGRKKVMQYTCVLLLYVILLKTLHELNEILSLKFRYVLCALVNMDMSLQVS